MLALITFLETVEIGSMGLEPEQTWLVGQASSEVVHQPSAQRERMVLIVQQRRIASASLQRFLDDRCFASNAAEPEHRAWIESLHSLMELA